MKFLFLDEFKTDIPNSDRKMYGIAGILIDSLYYSSFKKTFQNEIQQLDWDKKFELKGRLMFSSKGDLKVKIIDRIKFMSRVMNLSKSTSGKTAKIHTYVSIDFYDKNEREFDCYVKNLQKIIKKLPKVSNRKKGLVGVYYDNNDSLNENYLNESLEKELVDRGLHLFESSISIKSSLKYPGIMFADYVCYFHQQFLLLTTFRKENMEKIVNLLAKSSRDESEEKQLRSHLINYSKELRTRELITSLKKVIYV